MKKILIATCNIGKFKEIKNALGVINDIEFVSLKDLGITDDIEETANTYEGNSVLKAEFFYKKSGLPTIADDSGISLDEFPDTLGVNTKRFLLKNIKDGESNDDAILRNFLDLMNNVENRKAVFISCISYKDNSDIVSFEGHCHGVILNKPEGSFIKNIPISSIFKPNEADKVYSMLSIKEKDLLSHRIKAAHKIKNFILQKKL